MRRILNLGLGCGLAAVVAGASPAPARAEGPVRPTLPPVADPGGLGGVWNNVNFKPYRTGPPVGAEPSFRTADGEPVPLRPEAAKIVADRRKGVSGGKPFANNSSRCLTDGMPQVTSTPAELPIQIVVTPGQVTFLYEFFNTFRIVHLNETHPNDPDPTFMGNAVGHWDGATLVIDTTAISEKTNIMGVIPHSEDLHVVERIRSTGPGLMEDTVTIDDPKTFTKPWTMVSRFKRVAGMKLKEFVCENNRNTPDSNGTTGVQLQSRN